MKDHHIDFYRVQELFIDRIRKEEHIELLPHEVEFHVRVNAHNTLTYVVYIYVFGREFSTGM